VGHLNFFKGKGWILINQIINIMNKENVDWKPNTKLKFSPIFTNPLNGKKILQWIFMYPGLILPWGIFFIIISSIVCFYILPILNYEKIFSIKLISIIFFKNYFLICFFWGFLHFFLYVEKVQKNKYKYNHKFPKDNNRIFLFKNQTYENLFWTLISGVPIWSLYEIISLWALKNNLLYQINFLSNPIYFILLTIILIPIYHEFHFYCIHRIIHWPPIYKRIHYIHHKNINPGPWSGLSMHPIEHILYFSGVLIFFIIPVHPFHIFYHLIRAAIGPALTHSGFGKFIVNKEKIIHADHLQHYLHHKYFDCNYGDIIIPLDEWFGTFHDGSNSSYQKLRNTKDNN